MATPTIFVQNFGCRATQADGAALESQLSGRGLALAPSGPLMGSHRFLNPELADADGLVGVGGQLSPAWLIEAYRQGIFPYYDDTSPILWWSPRVYQNIVFQFTP